MTQGKVCEVCGEEFFPKRSDAKFCSHRCRNKRYQENNSEYIKLFVGMVLNPNSISEDDVIKVIELIAKHIADGEETEHLTNLPSYAYFGDACKRLVAELVQVERIVMVIRSKFNRKMHSLYQKKLAEFKEMIANEGGEQVSMELEVDDKLLEMRGKILEKNSSELSPSDIDSFCILLGLAILNNEDEISKSIYNVEDDRDESNAQH